MRQSIFCVRWAFIVRCKMHAEMSLRSPAVNISSSLQSQAVQNLKLNSQKKSYDILWQNLPLTQAKRRQRLFAAKGLLFDKRVMRHKGLFFSELLLLLSIWVVSENMQQSHFGMPVHNGWIRLSWATIFVGKSAPNDVAANVARNRFGFSGF